MRATTKEYQKALQELRLRFFEMRRLMRSRLPDGLRDRNTWLRVETLHFIAEHRGCAMGDVAHYLLVSAPSASTLVAALSRSGYIRRARASDRRSTELYLTAQGRTELKRAERISLHAMKEVFGILTKRETEVLISLLRKVAP